MQRKRERVVRAMDGMPSSARTLLCIGAHADDIEIGAGASVLQLITANPRMHVVWVVLSARGEREREAHASAEAFLDGVAESDVYTAHFRDGYFPYEGASIKEYFDTLKTTVDPDLVLTHHRHDRHQDHRIVSDLTWNSFRDHTILEYEIPKYDGDLGTPNVFVPVSADKREIKLDLLMRIFPTQAEKPWFTRETFDALMRLRGIECNSASGYAEAFHGYKILWDPSERYTI